jgi:transcription antitermination factor NusG
MKPPEALTGQRVVRTGLQGQLDVRAPLGSRQLLNLGSTSDAIGSLEEAQQVQVWGLSGRWYCVQAYPEQIIQAYNELVARNLTTFVPLFRNKAGNVEPMFGTYFFVNFDRDQDTWEHIFHMESVYQILSLSSATPSPLPPGVIESLIDRTGLSGVVDERQLKGLARPTSKTSRPRFNLSDFLGKPLRVKDGPFTSFHCVGIASTKDRIKVLLDMFGRTSEVDLRFDQLELRE